MDIEDAGCESGDSGGELTSRAPTEDDLVLLCRRLNELGAEYMVIGGFAMIRAGYPRTTADIDLLLDTSPENEARIHEAMEVFPDKAIRQLEPGEIARYSVVRVADEVTVDLMQAACGITYLEATAEMIMREVQGVPIPFASPRLLWKMKKPLGRAKDGGDLAFLNEYFKSIGESPPVC